MTRLLHVPVAAVDPDRLTPALTAAQAREFQRTIERGREALSGRVVWSVNSTAAGGGVAEMLRSLHAYARGGGVDARWVVMHGSARFFQVTKRIHNRLHGQTGDGGRLGRAERVVYERTAAENARDLIELVSPGDIVLLHDPQTAGLAGPLREIDAHVVWRCHVGLDVPNRLARSAWRFLLPYVADAEAYVFSRRAFEWDGLDPERMIVIPPSIDAFSVKNEELGKSAVAAILHAAAIETGGARGRPLYRRHDGTPGRVDRDAEMIEVDQLTPGVQLVAQISRWDRLKDPLGVIDGFVSHVAPRSRAHLLLAGPDVLAVADDPEGAGVFRECVARWHTLADDAQRRVHLALLPMDDAEENAAIVNALQRRADVVVQKSIAEGFGLTVAEAMWKGRPVVASRVGGIQDQIVDGVSGILVDPGDLEGFGDAVTRLVNDTSAARRMGEMARERVREEYLGARHLGQYLAMFEGLLAQEPERARSVVHH